MLREIVFIISGVKKHPPFIKEGWSGFFKRNPPAFSDPLKKGVKNSLLS